MRNYEVTFIVDPVLSGGEIKATAQTYVKHLEKKGCKIVHFNEMGLLQLAYPINRRTSGIYFCVEFEVETGALIDNLELAFRRDERIMRFLTVSLDKYGVKYNDDKRNGLIGKSKKQKENPEKVDAKTDKPSPKPAVKKAEPVVKEAPVEVAAPVVAAPVVEEAVPEPEVEAPVAESTEAEEVVVAEEATLEVAEPVAESTEPVEEKTDEVAEPVTESTEAVEEKADEVAEPDVTDEVKSDKE